MATQLQIPVPCHEKWSEMSAVRHDCRHCAACDRQIVDFTLKTDAEILKHLSENKGKICGRFAATQIERPLFAARNVKKGGFTAIAASFAAALAAQQPAANLPFEQVTVEQVPADNRVTMGKLAYYEYLETDSMRTISGKVVDELGNALPGASVIFANTNLGARCGVEGNFSLKIPVDSLKHNPLEIQIRYTGYPNKTVALPERILNEDLSLLPEQTRMEDSFPMLLGEVVYCKPPAPKSGVRNFFQKLFH